VRSPIPRFAVPATDRRSFGAALAMVAEALGTPLMPWQTLVADIGLEYDGERLAYRDVLVATPRQSGKSSLVLALIVYRMLATPDQRIVYGAQTRLAARTKLFDVWWPRIRRARPFGEMFSITRATGAESLRCSNGSVMSLLSGDESAAHGETLDLAVLDECWALDAAAEQSCRPAMATRGNGQMWLLSTAGTARSTFWRSKVDVGRAQAELGVSEGLAYFEWSAANDVDVTDPQAWPDFMPALGITVDERAVNADLRTMPLAQWRRAYANQWADETDQAGWSVISRDAWMAARL
jgi:phage terminase large subunit-like protein